MSITGFLIVLGLVLSGYLVLRLALHVFEAIVDFLVFNDIDHMNNTLDEIARDYEKQDEEL